MKAFNAFKKPYEALQRSVKIKIEIIFFSSRIGAEKIKT